MWFAQHLDPAVPVNIAQYVELRGALELDALRQACADAGREIGSAFVRIFEIDAQPYQIIDPHSMIRSVTSTFVVKTTRTTLPCGGCEQIAAGRSTCSRTA